MAKEKKTKPSPDPLEQGSGGPSAADDLPEVRAAEEAVRRAQEELGRAQDLYRDIRQQATEQIRQVREQTIGDLIDGTLRQVRKHPGPGVILAAVIGFFLGRLFRR